jgi:hypothetical protein
MIGRIGWHPESSARGKAGRDASYRALSAKPSQALHLNRENTNRPSSGHQACAKLVLMNRRVIGARQQTRAEGRQADRIPGYDRVETTERARKIRGMDADIRDWPRFFWTWVHIGNIHRRRTRDGGRIPGRVGPER